SDLHARRPQDSDDLPRCRGVVGCPPGARGVRWRRRGSGPRAVAAVRLGRLEAPTPTDARAPSGSFGPSARGGTGLRAMSASRTQQADRVAGFLCAFSFVLSGIALTRNPALLATAAILVALVAVMMTEAHRTLAAVAFAVAGLSFVLGMVVAVLTDS